MGNDAMGTPADDALVKQHEPLVRKLALRVRGQLDLKTDLDELMAYGFRGLLEAHSRFDPSRGVQFTTFAYYRVRGAIFDGVREMAYLPRKAHAHRRAAEELDRAAEEEALTRATDPKVRADAGAALAAVDHILGRTCAAFVISVVGQDDASAPPGPEEALIGDETRARVRSALDVLDERERTLVEGYYFEDRTLDEMGAEMGISKSWASRICTRALEKMRRVLERGSGR